MKPALTMTFFLLTAYCCSAQTHQLVKKWETDSVFKVPESVLFDKANNLLYITNIDGEPWGADGKGSVGKMDADGKNIVAAWVTGLQAPKGMGLYKGKLYVADLTEIVVIDVAGGIIENRIKIEGAVGLNDISIDRKGVIYVSDSKAKKVYRVEKGVPALLLENLKGPNGVLAHKKALYVLDAGSLHKVNAGKTLTEIAGGMEGSTDGVEVINGKDFIVSTWVGVVYYVSADGNKQVLLDGREAKINSADIGMDAKKKIIFVPTFWRNTVVAYEVK